MNRYYLSDSTKVKYSFYVGENVMSEKINCIY